MRRWRGSGWDGSRGIDSPGMGLIFTFDKVETKRKAKFKTVGSSIRQLCNVTNDVVNFSHLSTLLA